MIHYDAELIDLNDYERSGEGANGESYNHRSNPDLMVKIYNETMDIDLIYFELEVAKKVFEAGIPSPEPGTFITDGNGRYGIKFKRLTNKISYARAVGNHPEEVEKYARMFAQMCRELHSTHLKTEDFPSVKGQYLKMLAENTYWSDKQKEFFKNLILTTPDTDTAIHGDLQYGNLLLMDGKSYFIDLGEFATGHPYFDLGMTYVCCILNEESFIQEFFHMSAATASRFWDFFVNEYFEGKLSTEQANELLYPYAMLKALLIERNMKGRFDQFHERFLAHYGF